MKNTAELSKDRKYRYALWRTWDENKGTVLFICLNPSTADEKENDPTVNKCIKYAKKWGYGSVCMANLFAFRATDPSDMKASKNPIGLENDAWLKKLSKTAKLTIAAWGNEGSFMGRSTQVKNLLPNMKCIKINKTGEPSHPLYRSLDLKPISFK